MHCWTSVATSLRSRYAGGTFLVLSELLTTQEVFAILTFEALQSGLAGGEGNEMSEGASMRRLVGDGDNEFLPMVGQKARRMEFWTREAWMRTNACQGCPNSRATLPTRQGKQARQLSALGNKLDKAKDS